MFLYIGNRRKILGLTAPSKSGDFLLLPHPLGVLKGVREA